MSASLESFPAATLFHVLPPYAILSPSIFPVPDLLKEASHIDLLSLHLNHPRMLEHSPGRSASAGLLLQASRSISIVARELTLRKLLPAFNEILKVGTPFNLWFSITRRFIL